MAVKNLNEPALNTDVVIPDPGPDEILGPGHDYATVTDRIAGVVYLPWKRSPKKWLVGAAISFFFVNVLTLAVCYLFLRGVGIWGINMPVAWGFAITNFVWWIGIGHAGTFISAFLLLMRQEWRSSINRFADAIVGGWQLSSIVRFSSGLPVRLTAPSTISQETAVNSKPRPTKVRRPTAISGALRPARRLAKARMMSEAGTWPALNAPPPYRILPFLRGGRGAAAVVIL